MLLIRFDKTSTDLPTHCDGCYKPFDLCHALECKKGGLVICCHNKSKDKLVALAAKAFTPPQQFATNRESIPVVLLRPMQRRHIQTPSSGLQVIPRKQTGATS
jgi:hypothetical protein